MFHSFDNTAAQAFVETVRTNEKLQRRIKDQGQLTRLRILGNVLYEKSHFDDDTLEFIELLVDEDETGNFYDELRATTPQKKKLAKRSSRRNKTRD